MSFEAHRADSDLPPRKAGWQHSERVLVYYLAVPELGVTDKWGIAYYHYEPPFSGSNWTDFNNPDRPPFLWWNLPLPILS